MARITISDLRSTIEECNQLLQERKSKIGFVNQGRNGYQAVDEIAVDKEGNRIGSGVNRNVGCGTSRECIDYVWQAYHAEVRYPKK